MAEGFFALEYLDALMDLEEEEEDEMERYRITRRILRDALDPFDVPEEVFRGHFRLSRVLAMDLCDFLRPALQPRTADSLSVERQVCIALRFFATGSNQAVVGRDAYLSVSQPAVSRCIKNVSLAINRILFREWVKFPTTPAERQHVKRKFATAPQPFVGALGAIDCTHVAIIAPSVHEEAYLNHHGFHSMDVQMVCDPDFKILQVCARYGGRNHDSFIWNASPVRANMIENYERGERGTYIIGDSGYPLEPWLLTPLPEAVPGSPEFDYTSYHCKARSVIERCFGMLKSVWHCLSKRRVLWYGPVAAGRIINACAVLHNLRLHYNMEEREYELEEEDDVVGANNNHVEEYEADDPDEQVAEAVHVEAPAGRARLEEAHRVLAAYITQLNR